MTLPDDATAKRFELGTDGPTLILVGVDGSRTSMRAASYAGGLARRQRCPLACVYVRSIGAAVSLNAAATASMVSSTADFAVELQRQIDDRAHEIGVEVTLHVAEGDPYSEISRFADELRADAVIVGASESAGHRLIGSLAARLVKAGKWPVTVVP